VNVRARIRNKQDVLAGLLFAAIGAVTVIAALDYPFGTSRNIGPGYFPVMLGCVLVLLGGAIAFKGLALTAEPVGALAVRPLILVTAAVVAFGLLIRPTGLAVATVALVVISSLAGREFSLLRVVLLSIGLVALSAGIFIYLLGLPMSLWPG
jgi:hypothetical protein